MVRVLHTSDIHIGKVFEQFGSFGETLRKRIKDTFRKVMDLAASEHVDAVLLAGDAFDSQKVSQADIRLFLETVSSVRPIPVFFLPGTWTHDGFLQNPLYRSRHFLTDKPDNLHVFTKEEVETFRTAAGDLAIHGRAVLPDSGNPLEGIRPDPHALHNIGILHIGIALPQLPEEPGKCLLRKEHVADCGLSYLALGDWHVSRRCFEDAKTVVQYSGSPETVQFDDEEQSGFVALVTFGTGVPEIETRRAGFYKWKSLEAQWETVGSAEGLKAQIAALADTNRVLRVLLRGTLAAKDPINWVRIREELEPKFAHLELDTSRLKAELPLEELQKTYRANTVEHTFVTLVEDALKKAQGPEEANRLREVLRRGHSLFQGIEEVKS